MKKCITSTILGTTFALLAFAGAIQTMRARAETHTLTMSDPTLPGPLCPPNVPNCR